MRAPAPQEFRRAAFERRPQHIDRATPPMTETARAGRGAAGSEAHGASLRPAGQDLGWSPEVFLSTDRVCSQSPRSQRRSTRTWTSEQVWETCSTVLALQAQSAVEGRVAGATWRTCRS